MPSRKSHTTVLEVDLDAMIHNLNYFRSKLDFRTRLVAMVKAGSYGAGDFEVAQMLQHQGVDYPPWRSPTRACCCASGGSRCPSWCSTPTPTVSIR